MDMDKWTNVDTSRCGHANIFMHIRGDMKVETYIWTHNSRHSVMEKKRHNTQEHTDMPIASLRPR